MIPILFGFSWWSEFIKAAAGAAVIIYWAWSGYYNAMDQARDDYVDCLEDMAAGTRPIIDPGICEQQYSDALADAVEQW